MAANYGKNMLFQTKLTHPIYHQNINLGWNLESTSQGLFKNGLSLELIICFIVLTLKTKNSKITKLIPYYCTTKKLQLQHQFDRAFLALSFIPCYPSTRSACWQRPYQASTKFSALYFSPNTNTNIFGLIFPSRIQISGRTDSPHLVWDETASGTARSKTDNGLHSWSAHRFCLGQDCLWDSEEQHSEWNGMYILCFVFSCPRGSLVPYKNKEQISCTVHF